MTERPDEGEKYDDSSQKTAAFAARIEERKSARFWKSATFILLLASILVIFRHDVMHAFGKKSGADHIARIRLDGFITEDRDRNAFLDELAKDDSVKAVLLHIDSPGGTLVGGEDLYRHLKRIRAKKPLVALAGGTAASGAYMAAVAADRIFVRYGSIVGSVGVVFETVNLVGLAEKAGVSMLSYASGALKAQPSPFEKPSPEAVKVVKSLVDDIQDMFLGMVTSERKLSPENVALISDGRIFSGKRGVEIGLADAVGDEEDALKWLREEKKLDEKLRVVDKEPKKSRQNFLERLKDKTVGAIFGKQSTRGGGLYAVSGF
ncbi:MAG: signal peptide peptidase SppA [Rickettsiales bacterium]